jgi:hypothetical protein
LLNGQSGSVLGDSTVFSWAGCHNVGPKKEKNKSYLGGLSQRRSKKGKEQIDLAAGLFEVFAERREVE